MNLLEATSCLIDCAKTYGHENDRQLQRSIRRMEKRLRLLKRRQLRALRRLRWDSWYDACIMLGDRPSPHMNQPRCPQCRHVLTFREFVHNSTLRQRGHVWKLLCPQCYKCILGYACGENDPAEPAFMNA